MGRGSDSGIDRSAALSHASFNVLICLSKLEERDRESVSLPHPPKFMVIELRSTDGAGFESLCRKGIADQVGFFSIFFRISSGGAD